MLKLFSTDKKEFLKTVYKSEAELNKFLSDNWKHFFPHYTFIKSEFTLDGNVRSKGGSGRIDILAFNPRTNKVVVFELKRDLDKNIRNQVSDYRDFIEDNIEKVYLLSTENYSVNLPKFAIIAKDGIEVVLISKEFSANDIEKARKSKNEITLIKYFWFENEMLLLDYLNNDPDELIEKKISEKKSKSDNVNKSVIDGGKINPLPILTQGKTYKQLVNSGMKIREVAGKFNYTPQHIRDCIKLLDAPEELKAAIERDQITGSVSVELMRRGGDISIQTKILKKLLLDKKGKKISSRSVRKAIDAKNKRRK